MEKAFARAQAFVARWEGGFVNHPSDPGGATNRGVSIRFLRSIGCDIDGDGDIDIDDIKAITPEIAARLFHTHFWLPAGCDKLPPLVAGVVYDGAVNMGISRAIKQLQATCNRFAGNNLLVDGCVGPRTLARIKELCQSVSNQEQLAMAVIRERDVFYHGLAGMDARYKTFLNGWLNRTKALRHWVTREAQLMREQEP